jgi:hypothetical protein
VRPAAASILLNFAGTVLAICFPVPPCRSAWRCVRGVVWCRARGEASWARGAERSGVRALPRARRVQHDGGACHASLARAGAAPDGTAVRAGWRKPGRLLRGALARRRAALPQRALLRLRVSLTRAARICRTAPPSACAPTAPAHARPAAAASTARWAWRARGKRAAQRCGCVARRSQTSKALSCVCVHDARALLPATRARVAPRRGRASSCTTCPPT